MTKKFLYIVDELTSLNVQTDTTLALMAEAHTRKVTNFACVIKDIFLRNGELWFMSAPVELRSGYKTPPTYLEALKARPAHEFQVIFMRKDPPVDDKFLAALFMLRCYEPNKTVMLNDPNGVLLANEKLFGYKIAPQCFPPTLVTSDKNLAKKFAEDHEKIVLKPLFRSGGSGVLIFDKSDRNLASALEILTDTFTTPVMVQSYIKNARDGDKRIIVLGGQAMGAIMRVPRDDDHRANFHAGGYAKAAVLDNRDQEIVEAIRPHLVALGLHFVGIDVIGGYLTEINVTSPTCVIEIEQMSEKSHQRPLRAKIMDYVEGLIA